MPRTDPRPFLGEVHAIIAAADFAGRDLTPSECDRCEALLDAAEALGRLALEPRTYGPVAYKRPKAA